MRILVFSDTHSDVGSCADVIERIQGTDMILHCGDYLRDALKLEKAYPEKEFRHVAGNCDPGATCKEEIITADGKKIFLTHGDLYGVKSGYERITYRARELGADIAVFGHTHIPLYEKIKIAGGTPPELILLNPGSVRYTGTYGVIETEDGNIRACTIKI